MKHNGALAIQNNSAHCHVGDVLSKIMQFQGVDVSQLSSETNIPIPTLNRLKSSKNSNPTLSTLLPIANYFNITINQLIGKESLPQDADAPLLHKKSTANFIPFISIEDAASKLALTNYPMVKTSASVSKNSFAIAVTDTCFTAEFSDNAILIFDPALKANHRDYVIVRLNEQKNPILRQLLIDGDDYYFKPLSKALGEMVLSKKHQIVAVMVQAVMNYREQE